VMTNILIVDDSEFVRSYHSTFWNRPLQVITAVDGSDGLEKLYANSATWCSRTST
jgi:hypothetical protein